MNKLILVFGIVMISISSYAQNIPFKIQKSELFKDEVKESQIVLSEEDGNGGILIVRSYEGSFSGKHGYLIEHYDSNLKLIKDYNYIMKPTGTQKYKFELGVFTMSDNINIIQAFYDINERCYICVAHCINLNDFSSIRKELFRLSSEEIKEYSGFSMVEHFYSIIQGGINLDGNFESQINENPFPFSNKSRLNSSNESNSGLAIAVNKDKNAFSIGVNFNNKKLETVKLYLFDNQLNKKNELVYSKEIKDRKYLFQNINLSKDGNSIFLLSKSFLKDENNKLESGKLQFEITKFTHDKEETKFLDTKEHSIGTLKSIIVGDRLIYTGFYSDENDYRYKGLSYFELNPTSLEILNSKFNPFTDQFVLDKYGKQISKELKYLKFKNFLVTENNEIIFNAEEYQSFENNHSFYSPLNGGFSSYSGKTNYRFDDIVTIAIDKNGSIKWAKNINKNQTKEFDDISFISFTSTVIKNDIYFFINANEAINTLSNNRIEFKDSNKNKSNLNLIRINEKGDFEYEKILDDEENEVPFMVAKGIPLDNSVFFLGKKGSTKQLLKVTL